MPRTIYLNHATTGWPKLPEALEAASAVLAAVPSDVRHSARPAIEQARAEVAALLGANSQELFFAADATLALNCILRGYLRPGDHCLTDNRQHNAVSRTLADLPGVEAAAVPLYDLAEQPDPAALLSRLRPQTRLVCLMHTSNVTGSVYDLASLIAAIRNLAPGCAVLVDAAQSAGATDLLPAMAGDFVVFPGHKHLRALPGAAVLLARRRLRTVIAGGTGTHSARQRMDDYPQHFVEVGTPNLPAITALAASMNVAAGQAAARRAALEVLAGRLWSGLTAIPGIVPLGRAPGPGAARTGIVAARVPGSAEREWVGFLAGQGVILRGGYHCCPAYHESAPMLTGGSLRFSPGPETPVQDIDHVLNLVEDFCKMAAA